MKWFIALGSSIFAGLFINFLVAHFTIDTHIICQDNKDINTNSDLEWIDNKYETWASLKINIPGMLIVFLSASVALISAVAANDAFELLALCLLGWTLLLISIIDLKIMILPDVLCFFTFSLGILFAYFNDDQIGAAIVGTLVGYGVLRTFASLYTRIRGHPGIGLGDAKLLGAGGAWTGWTELPDVVLVASIAGVISMLMLTKVMKVLPEGAAIPFGPVLALGIWTVRLLQH